MRALAGSRVNCIEEMQAKLIARRMPRSQRELSYF